jgi:hypothetical protein
MRGSEKRGDDCLACMWKKEMREEAEVRFSRHLLRDIEDVQNINFLFLFSNFTRSR